jgi:type IV pilus assembly protein PilA
MRKQKSDSYSILLDVCIALLKVGGGLLLTYIGLIALLLVPPLFFSVGIKDKQVEIFVPSFLSMANKARQSEAKQYVASMNKAQQASFAENNAFATSIDALGLGIKTETTNYKYSLRVTQTSAFSYAEAKANRIKNYFGGVFLVPAKELDPNADKDEVRTVSILCEMDDRPLFRVKPADEPGEPIYQNGKVICGKGTTDMNK